jgi:hypothetical protein
MLFYAVGFVASNLSDPLVMTTTNYESNLEFSAYWKQSATYTIVPDDSSHPNEQTNTRACAYTHTHTHTYMDESRWLTM